MSVESEKTPKIALAKAHEKAAINVMATHREKCEEWRARNPNNCLICRNVYDEWLIAARNLERLLK